MSYCAICDTNYRKGNYSGHKLSFRHQACLNHRRKMAIWYRNNGR